VEQAASLVQAAVDPDALTIFGATFDESLDDEIRVIVIATGFEKKEEAKEAAPAAKEETKPFAASSADVWADLFGKPAAPAAEEPKAEEAQEAAPAAEEENDDPFADILKIFDNK
jgi:cell division protein FtsZ